jgi:AcrR family transcriptional regulator
MSRQRTIVRYHDGMTSTIDSDTDASLPRERLLDTASRLFYAEGIHAVGVDRLVSEASVTRATFYRHFAGKEGLVVAYLQAKDALAHALLAAAEAQTSDPVSLLHAVVVAITEDVCSDGFRSCPFINAAAEYPDSESPVRQAVQAHRAWFHDTLLQLLTSAGHPDPSGAAARLVILRDGAMVGGYLDNHREVLASLATAVNAVIAESERRPG